MCGLKEVQRLGINSFVQTIRGSFVQQIEPAKDAMRMEEAVKLFSTAFEQVWAQKYTSWVVGKDEPNGKNGHA